MNDAPLASRLFKRDPSEKLAFPDDDFSFLYPFDPELPEHLAQVGVKVSPEVEFEMKRLMEQSEGRLYSQVGAKAFINLFEGPLEGVGLLEMKRLIVQIEQRMESRKLNWLQRATALLTFVQREIEYRHDLETEGFLEYARFPLQTLTDGQGDCECVALLLCALLAYCGFDSALILLGPDPGESAGHALTGLKPRDVHIHWWHRLFPKVLASKYLWGEATAGDAGWIAPPDDLLERVEKVYVIPANSLVDEGE